MYKIETHVHTLESSSCGKLSAEEMVLRYKQAGFSTLVITDHYKTEFFKGLENKPLSEQLDAFFLGYKNAKVCGDSVGVTVLCGLELQFAVFPHNHYLIYGITDDFLYKYPNLYDMPLEKVYQLCKENGFLFIQAHPYRDGKCYPTPNFVDGFEVYNSNPRHENFTEKTRELLDGNQLYCSAGSDAHRIEDVGQAGLLSKRPVLSIDDLITLIKSGEAQIYRGEE